MGCGVVQSKWRPYRLAAAVRDCGAPYAATGLLSPSTGASASRGNRASKTAWWLIQMSCSEGPPDLVAAACASTAADTLSSSARLRRSPAEVTAATKEGRFSAPRCVVSKRLSARYRSKRRRAKVACSASAHGPYLALPPAPPARPRCPPARAGRRCLWTHVR